MPDLIVIGGGIHGVGVAQAAAAAGYSVLVLEQTGLAHGTSSRSSKLIHGGLRYLETAQFSLVRKTLHERSLLLRNAPELVKLTPFHIPVYGETTRRPWQIRAGLILYGLLTGLRRDALHHKIPRSRWHQLDGLETRHLQAVYQYWDAQTDDAALTRAVMSSAEQLGAELACPARFVSATPTARGMSARWEQNGAAVEKECQVLVNAGGPWVNIINQRIDSRAAPLAIDLVQGAHIVIDAELTRGIYYTEAISDRRAIFTLPGFGKWRGKTLVGTTETQFQGDPEKVKPLAEEIDYLQSNLRHYFPHMPDRIIDSFAGLRVLPRQQGSAFQRPRDTILVSDSNEKPRHISIYGGKLTSYRAEAQRIMQLAKGNLPEKRPRADTRTLALKPVQG